MDLGIFVETDLTLLKHFFIIVEWPNTFLKGTMNEEILHLEVEIYPVFEQSPFSKLAFREPTAALLLINIPNLRHFWCLKIWKGAYFGLFLGIFSEWY